MISSVFRIVARTRLKKIIYFFIIITYRSTLYLLFIYTFIHVFIIIIIYSANFYLS